MAKAINLSNGRAWNTQSAALAHFKDMLARYADEEVVEDRVDHDDLIALLERYDAVIVDGPSKIGNGVDFSSGAGTPATATRHQAFGCGALTGARRISAIWRPFVEHRNQTPRGSMTPAGRRLRQT